MKAQKILVMGLPGSGKTYLSNLLKQYIEHALAGKVDWFNADEVRKRFDDWDFSRDGRIRQSIRMADLAAQSINDYVICDFVAPLTEMRENFAADWTIWVDSIDEGRFEDTNKAFIPPTQYDYRITEKNAEHWVPIIGKAILNNQRRSVFNWRAETVQMLGRWQPWHAGHRALFERLLERTGQVIIQVRDVEGWQGSNPFAIEQVKNFIRRDLDPLHQGKYEIQVVPNIVHIGWGRGVGYTSGEETFDQSITDISGTNIRKAMGLK
jgi:adenylylsulfate kinase